jgi:hypothetical protein
MCHTHSPGAENVRPLLGIRAVPDVLSARHGVRWLRLICAGYSRCTKPSYGAISSSYLSVRSCCTALILSAASPLCQVRALQRPTSLRYCAPLLLRACPLPRCTASLCHVLVRRSSSAVLSYTRPSVPLLNITAVLRIRLLARKCYGARSPCVLIAPRSALRRASYGASALVYYHSPRGAALSVTLSVSHCCARVWPFYAALPHSGTSLVRCCAEDFRQLLSVLGMPDVLSARTVFWCQAARPPCVPLPSRIRSAPPHHIPRVCGVRRRCSGASLCQVLTLHEAILRGYGACPLLCALAAPCVSTPRRAVPFHWATCSFVVLSVPC